MASSSKPTRTIRKQGLQKVSAGWLADLGSREEACETHGAYTSLGRKIFSREIWTKCPACAKEAEAAEIAEEERRRNEAKQERLLKQIRQAAIPPRFEDRTFDAYVAETDAQEEAREIARDYAGDFSEVRKRGYNLVMIGKTGTGKTHLACAILRAVLDQGYTGMYTSAMRMIRNIRDTWRSGSPTSEVDLLNQLERIDLLVLDEVGAQYGTGSEQLILGGVIERRYESRAPTIIIGNETLRGVRACIGERAYDRLRESGRSVRFDWESHRKSGGEWP